MSGIRLQGKDCFNLKWLQFGYLDIFSRQGLDQGFQQLCSNDEIQTVSLGSPLHSSPFIFRNLFLNLPDFESSPMRQTDYALFLKQFQVKTERASVNLFSDSPCMIVLHQRLVLLARISQAVVHSQELHVIRDQQLRNFPPHTGMVDVVTQQEASKRASTTTDMLIETGVRTGLQLFFSLIKQQMQISQTHPDVDTQLCNEVLQCLRDTLSQFPACFLAAHNQIPALGQKCLHDLEAFLRQIVFQLAPIDTSSRCLAAETYLTLTIEKSSLTHLLEFFACVLAMKSEHFVSGNVVETVPRVSCQHLQMVLNEMYNSKTSLTSDIVLDPIQVEGEHRSFYQAIFLIFKQVLTLANCRCSSLTYQSDRSSNVSVLSDSCEVFGFGSNSSGQFGLGGDSNLEKTSTPTKLSKMSDCQFVCAGQYCTMVVYAEGYYKACGKGSYGRLGTGNSQASNQMVKVGVRGVKFTKISSSRGSDGHSLALTSDGQVYSWGEGECGRLGHGNSIVQKTPKLIEGPFIGKVVKSVSAGWKHSAAISISGELFTWGDGDGGKLGHNNSTSQPRPTLVSSITGVGHVACGSTHTLAVSQDGQFVWSWGSGDGGKLGHGNTNKQLVPKEIKALRGRHICKIQAGNHVSLALSTFGKVYSWGTGPALGRGSDTDTQCLEPWEMDTLLEEFIIDVSIGEAHCLALTKDHVVYGWGNNNIGQCGLGHINNPVYTPTKIVMPQAKIQQISAGTSHSIIWTALPTDRNDTLMSWPFCLDMTENTFKMLRGFLEKYCTALDSSRLHTPFETLDDNIEFVVNCLNLLKLHLKCAVFLSNSQYSIGHEIIPLGQLLFKLMDASTPLPIQNAVNETLEVGATLLIPPLSERLHFLWSLIPKDSFQWTQLTKGQLIQLQVMLESLGNEQTVMGLLMPLIPGVEDASMNVSQRQSTLLQLVSIMMKYILAYMDKKIEGCKQLPTEAQTADLSDTSKSVNREMSPNFISLFKEFLILLYKHILAYFSVKTELTEDQLQFLRQHLDTIIPGCLECLEKIKILALASPDCLHIMNDLSFPNALIPLVTHGLLLLPLQQLDFLKDPITDLCLQLSRTIELVPDLSALCELQEAQWKIGELKDPLLSSPLSFPLSKELASDWFWLVDTQRTASCLLGLLLNLLLTSLPVTVHETKVEKWTESLLLANGIQDNYREGLNRWKEFTNQIVSELHIHSLPFNPSEIVEEVSSQESHPAVTADPTETEAGADLILDLVHARTESNTCLEAYDQLIQFATVREWDTNGDDDIPGLKEVSCAMLATLAKHCSLSVLAPKHSPKTSLEVAETYQAVFRVRRELFSLRPLETEPSIGDDQPTNQSREEEFTQLCSIIRSLCLFLVYVVAPAVSKDSLYSDSTSSTKEGSKKQIKLSQKTSPKFASKTHDTTENLSEQSSKGSLLDPFNVYFQTKDSNRSADAFSHHISTISAIIATVTDFLMEPIELYKSTHFKEDSNLTSSTLIEETLVKSERDEALLEHIAFSLVRQKKRAELRLDAIKLVQSILLSRGNKPLTQLSSIHPTAFRLLQTCILGNSGLHGFQRMPFVVMGDISSAPRDLQLKIRSAFNKILSYVFKQIAQAAKACTKAVEKEKVPLYLDLVINMSWLQGKVQCSDVNEVCSPQILSVLAELSGIISTKLPLPFPVDNKLERCIRNIAALLFYYIIAVVGYNSETLNVGVLESVMGLLYGELEGQFIPYKPKIPSKSVPSESGKRGLTDRTKYLDELNIQSQIDFQELSLPFEFDHPVHPETLKQLDKLWSTITSEDREFAMGSYINFLSRVLSTTRMRAHFANPGWTGLLLRIAGVDTVQCLPRCRSIRTRMLALSLLSYILIDHPRESVSEKKKIVNVIFSQMSLCQFGQPAFHITKQGNDNVTKKKSADSTEKYRFENISISDPCTFEGNFIRKSAEGEAFLYMNFKLGPGVTTWKIILTNSDSSNNSVYVGVAFKPLLNTAIKSTRYSWTLDTFHGNLFHDGQLPELLSHCTTGDCITCVYDGVNKKLSFAKNSEPMVEAFDNVKGADIYPFISFNSKSTSASVEFSEEIASSINTTHRETVDLVKSELFTGSLPVPMVPERTCIGEGFVRLLRRLMRCKAWQSPIQACINERLLLMDSIVQLLVNKSNTGHVEVHHLCFSIWPVLSFLANRDPVLSVGGSVYLEDDNLTGILSLNDQKQPLLFFHSKDSKLQSPIQLSTDKMEALPLGKIDGFDWDQIGPASILNLAHLSGLWDDEEMNVLTAGAPVLSRGYAKHLLAAQDYKSSPSSTHTQIVPISITGSLEWRQILMWQMQAMALRTLQSLLTQDRFCQLLTYHPISISADSVAEDNGDLAQAVQQILRQIVSRSTTPSPLSPAVSISCLEKAHALLSRDSLVKLYTDCTDAVFGSDTADKNELALAAIPNPPPDIPKLYHPPQLPPPLPPKTRRSSPKPSLPIQPRPLSPDPAYVTSLIEMGFTEDSIRRARRKVKVKAGESIANQTSSLVMWLLEHGNEEDSGGESEVPPPIPPREEPFIFPLTLEQTLALEAGSLPSATAPVPADSTASSTDLAPVPPIKSAKSETDLFLEALFPDFSKTDFSYIAMLDKQKHRPCKDLLDGPETTVFIRDVYRNIPEVADELKEMSKRILFRKKSNSDLEHVTFSSDDPLGQRAVKSNKISCEKENIFSKSDGLLLNQCSGAMSLDELITSVDRITGAIKTQVSRQLMLLAFSSLSLKPQDFMYGLVNIGIQDIVLLVRLLRLSATNRLGCYSQGLDNSVCIASAIKQVLTQNRESLSRLIASCTRDILAVVFAAKNLSDSYFLYTHTSVNDNTIFATINFPVSKMLVEIVIEVINSTKSEETDPSIYGLVNLADALSACQFSQQLSSDDKEWAAEQLVKLLIVSKVESTTPIQIDLDMVDVLIEMEGHSKQAMSTVWVEATNRLYSISKDSTIRVWKVLGGNIVSESTLEFSSDTETLQLPVSPGKSEPTHKLIPPSVLPYFAVDVTGQFIAASREYTLNVWYIDSLAGGSKPVLKAVEELDRLITFSSFRPPPTPSPTDTERREYAPSLIIACIDGSVHTASVKLDWTGEGSLDVDVRELKQARLSDTGAVSKLVWDESGQTLAVGSSKGSVTLFSQKNIQEDIKRDKTLVLHENVVHNLQFNPSGTLLATLAEGEAIKVCGRLNGEWDSIGFIPLPNQSCFSWFQSDTPQSKHLLACGGDRGIVHVWSIPHWPYDIQVASQSDASALLEKQMELSATCYAQSFQVTCLAFSSSGTFVVAGHKDGTISVWLTNSGEEVLTTQIDPSVVSLTAAGHDRMVSCHLPSSSLYSLPLSPDLLFRTRTLYHCQAKLKRNGIDQMDSAPFLKAFLSQLGALLHKQHKFEQQEIASQKQLTHTRLHQSLSTLSLGLGLDRLWTQMDLSKLFPSSALLGEAKPDSWRWLAKFRQALTAVESFAKRSPLPDDFPSPAQGELSESEREARQPNSWSVDMDTQLMQWSNQHPEDWIVGGKARVYFWGAGGSGQLANESKSTNRPELCEYLECTQKVTIGVNCTYSINNDGSVYSFGDGSYGKLGHNNSESFAIPQCIEALQGYIVVQLSACKSGDGHCLALTHTGDTFSWGDGEYGRLGHGDSTKQRRPKRIEALKGKKVVMVSAGDKYSAVVTEEGQLYTFGSGAEGKTGHGNSDSKRAPKLVKFMKNGEEISINIGQVCCSQSHTLAVSQDGMEVFSFGDGVHYKLGNNSTTSLLLPQPIPELSGVGVCKVASGNSFSLALSNSGKVYAWGQSTECCSSTDVQAPRLLGTDVHGFSNDQVVDIQAGPDFALALTKSGEVWAWGSNKEGQLGLGDKDPRTQPCVVMDLVGKNIKQISAGKCHAAASTSPPTSACIPLLEIGQPSCVPTKFTALANVQTELLQERLRLLNQFSALIFSTWTLFSFNPFEFNSLDVLQSGQLSKPSIRPILSQNVYRSNMLQVLTHTMIASKSYGPMITVRRIPSEGHKVRPLFYQISPQILAKPKELLLPQRAWKVTLIGEGADDAGGVFDETIALMCIELEDGTLPYLIPTPNTRNRCGYNNDRFVFNPGCTSKKDREYFRFVGVMFGVAIRTKKPLALHLAPLVWKLVAGIEVTMDDLEEVDVAFMQAMRGIRHLSKDVTPETFSEMIPIPSFEAYNMAGQLASVMTGGSNIPLTYSNRKEYVERSIQFRLHELDRQALAVREGMALIVPVPLLGLTTGGQLEIAVCGEKELDIQILKKVAKYRDCSASDILIQWLWDSLENFTNDEKILFLRFTSGRSRLPAKVQDVTQRLLIVRTMKNRGLPTAQTCFFQLKLPDYPSQEILTSRLRYAINNCRSIDTDSYMLPRNTENGTYTDSDDDY